MNALKSELPKQAPLVIPRSADPGMPTHLNDPLRILHLKEACFHRITELTDSACDAFKKGNIVTAYLLMRAFMETFALFWYFVDQVEESLKHNDLEELKLVLTRMAIGVKANAGKKMLDQEGEKIENELLVPIEVK